MDDLISRQALMKEFSEDILEALQPRVYEIIYEHVQRALSND